jgi:VanZ family protein
MLWPAQTIRWLVWLLCFSVWTAALLVPDPAKSVGFQDENLELKFYLAKAVHVTAYVVLTILSAWLQAPAPVRRLLFAFLFVHAAGSEFLQWLLPTGREGCVRDVLIDMVGIGLGTVLSWRWWRDGKS